MRELRAITGIPLVTLAYHVRRMRRDGFITYQYSKARTIRLAEGVFVNSKGEIFLIWKPMESER